MRDDNLSPLEGRLAARPAKLRECRTKTGREERWTTPGFFPNKFGIQPPPPKGDGCDNFLERNHFAITEY
ncbi:MAG: hypothetical protein WBW88_09850, partial [Rhodothermales bacterium]